MGPVDLVMLISLLAGIAYVCYYAYATVSGLLGIAKESKVLSPSPLSDCPGGKEKGGALCYNKCRDGYERLAATCWLKKVGVGIGKSPGKKPCDSGQRDDGTSCWEDAKCNTYECGRLRGLFGEDWGPKLCTSCGGCGCIKKTAMDRYDCPGKDLIAGLCYDKCPRGMEHIPGAPTYCKPLGNAETSYTPTDDPGVPMTCPKGKVQDGALCYDDPGPGWKVVGGVAWKDCPPGKKEFGALCVPGDVPWYLSTYMLGISILMIVIPILYFRLRSLTAVATGGKRGGRGTKTR